MGTRIKTSSRDKALLFVRISNAISKLNGIDMAKSMFIRMAIGLMRSRRPYSKTPEKMKTPNIKTTMARKKVNKITPVLHYVVVRKSMRALLESLELHFSWFPLAVKPPAPLWSMIVHGRQ